MPAPLVSVIVITYNQKNYLIECLDSILLQDYSNIEIIVADDSSTDGTQDLLHDYFAKYPDKFILRLSDENKGITSNSNMALSACKGKYIAITGGDDVFLENKISKQVEWMEQDKSRVLCGHDVVWINGSGKSMNVYSSQLIPLSSGYGACRIIRHGPPFASSSMMFRHDKVPEYGFHSSLSIVSDWKFMIDLVSDGSYYGYIDGVFLKYRRHSGNITRTHTVGILRDQMLTCFLTLYHGKGNHLLCFIAFFIFGFTRKIKKFILNKN